MVYKLIQKIGHFISQIASFINLQSAFDEFSYLRTKTIGSGIRTIGDGVFRRIANNPTITIGTNQANVSLGNNAFNLGVYIQFSDGTITYGS